MFYNSARIVDLHMAANHTVPVMTMSPTPVARCSPAVVGILLLGLASLAAPARAQTPSNPAARPPSTSPTGSATRPAGQPTTGTARPAGASASTGIPIPSDYVIGPDDVLGIVFWRDTDMTGDVTVRPDGMITLPLLQDVKAAGLTPDQLRQQIQQAAAKFIADPNVTVTVRTINSRNVFITGEVTRPGPFPVSGQMTVIQLIAVAGGLTEYADRKNITIMRNENGKPQTFKFNYSDVSKGKNVAQNIVLKPGDTVVVP
jgi:polysaccharide export outer membrane protein